MIHKQSDTYGQHFRARFGSSKVARDASPRGANDPTGSRFGAFNSTTTTPSTTICLGRQKWVWHTHKYRNKTYDFLLYLSASLSVLSVCASHLCHRFICAACLDFPIGVPVGLGLLAVGHFGTHFCWLPAPSIEGLDCKTFSSNCRFAFRLLVQL